MVIGLLEMKLSIPGNRSLKGKRMELKSLKDRVHQKFNVSIAEVGGHEKWCSAELAVAVVTGGGGQAHKILENVARFVEQRRETVLLDYRIEML